MRMISTLAEQKPHRILTGITFLVSALSLYFIGYFLWEKHLSALKRFDVTQDLFPYLSTVFSDPVILLLTLLTVSLFGLNIVVTGYALKNSKYAALLHAIGLLLNMVIFFGILYKLMFAS